MTDEQLTRITEFADALHAAAVVDAERQSLSRQVDEQSQLIVALVRARGGLIDLKTWKAVHQVDGFRPYSKSITMDGVLISERVAE